MPIRFLMAAGLVGAFSVVACTGSEAIDLHHDAGAQSSTGAAGTSSGAAGTGTGASGVAGSSGGAGSAGGSSSGAGGTKASGGAGSVGGAGTAGGGGSAAGSAAGTSGVAGTGASGTTGASGAGGSKTDGGAGSTDAGGDAAPLSYVGSYIENVLILNCGGCHVPVNGKVQGNFAFSYTSLLSSVNPEHAGCPNLDATKKRVVPGKPDNSLIYIKASIANPPSACGGHMPFAGSSLSASNLKLIHDWIEQGAKP